jgi:hypothetical protein
MHDMLILHETECLQEFLESCWITSVRLLLSNPLFLVSNMFRADLNVMLSLRQMAQRLGR